MVNLPRQGLWLSPGGASIKLGNIPQSAAGGVPTRMNKGLAGDSDSLKKITFLHFFCKKGVDLTLFFPILKDIKINPNERKTI